MDDYNIWTSMDINEVNISHLLCVKYPKDEKWKQILEKLKEENLECRVIEKGRFEGVWVSLEIARKIALRHGIYEDVKFMLEPENTSPDQSTKHSRIDNACEVGYKSKVNLRSDAIRDLLESQELLFQGPVI
nr:1679_t:CDS:2 [Entrophospora candida]